MWWGIFISICLLLCLGCLLRSQYERHHIVTTEYEIASPKLEKAWNGYKVCFLSDLHNNTYGKCGLKQLEEKIDRVKPDHILIGGDMMCCRIDDMPDFQEVEDLICRLADRYPVTYALGNHEKRMHDYLKEQFAAYEETLHSHGVRFLVNDSILMYPGKEYAGKTTPICLSGLDLDWCYYVHKGGIMRMVPGWMEEALGTSDPSCFNLLLAHSPLYMKEYGEWGADLSLAGHFHGGTIRLPFVGGVMSPQFQFFCGRDRGRYEEDGKEMIVSGGLGTHSINLRLNNPSELVVLRFVSQDK